ncbi:MAG TPA: SMP-30/gluconolactonase/LRE family protein [Thermoleophilaceae bacterium]|nr:SMP-30/gluconolactonase/LRE family protein [Thermoleophilaceae bacterium]
MRSFGIAAPVGALKARLGEGPRWDAEAQRLLWVDIDGGLLHAGDRTIEGGAKVCAAAPWRGDTVLVALADALAASDVSDGSVRRLVDIPHAQPGMRCNDGACDAQGRFWIGTMAEDETPAAGALYRYDPDGTLHTVLTDITLSNGLGWDADGRRMYYVDSPTQRIDVLDFDGASGTVANRRPFAAIPEADGIPDGLAVDDEGGIWVALYGGGEVRRFDADGAVSGQVEVPVPKVTACCFAGNRLYVTAREGLFELDVPYSGPPARPFGGTPPTA